MKIRWTFWIPALLVSGAAHAQSSVTLYGVIDEGLDYTNNTGTGAAWRMQSGDVAGSRFGLKGSEDLGDGYTTVGGNGAADDDSAAQAAPRERCGSQLIKDRVSYMEAIEHSM